MNRPGASLYDRMGLSKNKLKSEGIHTQTSDTRADLSIVKHTDEEGNQWVTFLTWDQSKTFFFSSSTFLFSYAHDQ